MQDRIEMNGFARLERWRWMRGEIVHKTMIFIHTNYSYTFSHFKLDCDITLAYCYVPVFCDLMRFALLAV